MLYEGKAKRVYRTEEEGVCLVEFKDDATAFDGAKRGTIAGKGRFNAEISARLFQVLDQAGISNHFIRLISPREMLVKRVSIIPVEVVVRNRVAGSMARRLGLEEGRHLNPPVVEYYLKSDDLHDPMINEDHIVSLNLASREEISTLRETALRVNTALRDFLAERGIELVDFKLEFGRYGKQLIVADEISPDTCRFWDLSTRDKLDKDRFRHDLGRVEEAYEEVWRRLLN